MDPSRYFHDLAREASANEAAANDLKIVMDEVGPDEVDAVRYALRAAARLIVERGNYGHKSRIIVVPEEGYGDPKEFEVYP